MGAEIITIGTELLLGEIVDTNTRLLAQGLRGIGLDLFRTTTVGDNLERIAQAVRESAERAEAVLTTGGLGPTVDDPTREAVALAFGVPLEFREELWEQIQERFSRFRRNATENNRRQAYVPKGAVPIENPVGTAPAFRFETERSVVIALPGVPGEVAVLLEQEVLPYLRRRLRLAAVIHARILHTAGVGESWLDERIGDLELLTNPTVGIAAHPGRVDIRITAKAADATEAGAAIQPLETSIRERLGDAVFGADDETLEAVVLDKLVRRGWRLFVLERGTGGVLASSLTPYAGSFAGGEVIADGEADDLEARLQRLQAERAADIGVALDLRREGAVNYLTIHMRTPEGSHQAVRSYGGPPTMAAAWAASLGLDMLRRRIKD
ncbi:MAG TPA: CinA family nicotinamide mononucleotide deamidase-related protein [Anaerolineales bacterium]|nr:CinA family nicotinamide mononucleotide deamidase-related protein [Anaerolineales bacterium]